MASDVVTCFLRNRGEVLLTRRSNDGGTYVGRWAGVSGYVEEGTHDPVEDARREIVEETGVEGTTLRRAGDSLDAADERGEWTVHPFLFESPTRDLTPNAELADYEWAPPPTMLDRATVPRLWDAYRRVAPTVDDVRGDEEHGSAWISLRALEVLRDEAAVADDGKSVATVARDLRNARPSMAAVANRVNRAMSAAVESTGSGGRMPRPETVREAAEHVLDAAFDADDGAAETAVEALADAEVDGDADSADPNAEADDAGAVREVATLSRSGTVAAALRRSAPAVVVAESRPAREGVDVAEEFAAAGLDVTLTTDAALPALLAERNVAAALVGADAVLVDGSVVNKVGTRALALAAAREGVPLYAAAARDKVRPDTETHDEAGRPGDVYDDDADVAVASPLFDRTPADLVDGIATEAGLLDAADVRAVAAEHAELAAWDNARNDGEAPGER